MLIRLAAKTGSAPILQAGKAGALDPHDVQVGQEDWRQKNEGNQLWRMRLTLFAPSPFFLSSIFLSHTRLEADCH